MDDFDLDQLAGLEEAERKARETADKLPEIAEDESDCDGCKI